MKIKLLLAAVITLSFSALAQTYPQNLSVEPMNYTPTYHVTVISRTARAVNYKHRGGATKLDFAGTDSLKSKGFGNTLPVATNDNVVGRQQNRRVELLVSGEAIGSPVNATLGSLR